MDKKKMASEQTKSALKSSFLALCEKQGMAAVTVSAVAKKAGCNRCTFYNYYTDLSELLAEIEEDVLSGIRRQVSDRGFRPTDIRDAFEQFLAFFEDYGSTIYILLAKSGDHGFRSRFKESAFAIYRQALDGQLEPEQIEYLITYVSSAGLGLVEHWYESGKKCSADEFLRQLQTLLSSGILGYLQK